MKLSEPGYVWVPSEDSRVVAEGDERRCRMKGCRQQPVVMELARTRWNSERVHWWAYCADHMYGQRIADGIVWTKAREGSPMAKRARECREVVGGERA